MDRPVIVQEEQVPLESGNDPGRVTWRTLLSGDRTASRGLTVGVAELPPHASREITTHHHAPPEVYYVLEGEGRLILEDEEHPLRKGTTVYIPGGARHAAANTGAAPLRLVYIFPTDSFADVEYHFHEEPWRIE